MIIVIFFTNVLSLKKIFKVFFLSISAMIPLGFIIGFATAWNAPQSINVAGSSSVQPLMTALGSNYSAADVVVQSGGSGEGIKVAANLSKDLGNSSKNPYQTVEEATINKKGYDKSMWQDHDTKTITIAWDAIAIVYKPKNLTDPILNITQNNIYNLYTAFSGIKKVTYADLGISNNNNYLYPYARTGGANASGTATSFMTQSGFNIENWSSKSNNEVYNRLYDGDYVTGAVRTTSESNVDSWNMFSSENKEGAIIYLSLGFVSINRSIIEEQGYRIAKYDDKEPITENVKNHSYGWYSPLDTILSLKYANESTKNFVWWILTSQNSQDIIEKSGFISLSNEQKLYMAYDANDSSNATIDSSSNKVTWLKNWPNSANNDKEFESLFFSKGDYSLTYNINKKYFGVPKI